MATYYVSASGSDSNNGTSTGTPWQTIAKVNAVGLVAGDNLYFNGGDTFSGSLSVAPAATTGSRCIIGSYGSGRASISCGDSWGVKITNSGYVTVENLIVVGSGVILVGVFPDQTASTTSTEGGIYFVSTTPSTAYPGVVVTGCDVTGTLEGVWLLNTNTSATAAYSGALITGNYIYDVCCHGVWMTGTGSSGDLSGQIFSSPVFTGNIVYRISGRPSAGEDGGFCIRVFNASSPLIQGNKFSYSGWAATGFPVSVLLVQSTTPLVQYNDVGFFYTHGSDGQGIDCDIACTDAVVQFNYVHDSPHSAGLFNFQGNNNTFRYNIIERCNGGFKGAGGSCKVYHNTFYNTSSAPGIIQYFCAVGLYNNVITSTSGIKLIEQTGDPSDVSIIGNTYRVIGGSSFVVAVDDGASGVTTYTSLAAMRTAGLEKITVVNYGASGDPQFTDPGNGSTRLMTYPVVSLSNYDIGAASAAIGVGVPLSAVSITAPLTDFHGNSATITTPDSGAVRYGSVYSVGSNAGSPGPVRRPMFALGFN